MIDDEENLLPEEYKEHVSLTSSLPNTRPETGVTAKILDGESDPTNNESSTEKTSDTKSSSTRPARNAIYIDEFGNQWDADEWERKEKNPYRWYIEKQREKQMTKGPTQDEVAEGAMVKFVSLKITSILLFSRKHIFDMLPNGSVIGCMNSLVRKQMISILD